jgi:flavin-dependent dehydrogenase
MNRRTDVLIVGAGPAGCAAAIVCRQAGLSVAVVDARRRSNDRPGETLHPGIEVLFDRLGVGDAVRASDFIRHAGVEVRWDKPLGFVPYGEDAAGPWRGFQAWRSELDAILRDRVSRLGGQIHLGCRTIRPVARAGRVTGVETSEGLFAADWVIDAAGSRHWLARHLALPIQWFSPQLFATYGYLRRTEHHPPRLEADADGWTWEAEVREGLYQWTRLLFDETGAPLAVPAGQGKMRTADVGWRWVPDAAGPGYFAVGDAAVTLDPTSSHGVLRAVMCGMMAGHLLATTSANEGVTRYRSWLRTWVEQDVRALQELYARLPRPPDWLRSYGLGAPGA